MSLIGPDEDPISIPCPNRTKQVHSLKRHLNKPGVPRFALVGEPTGPRTEPDSEFSSVVTKPLGASVQYVMHAALRIPAASDTAPRNTPDATLPSVIWRVRSGRNKRLATRYHLSPQYTHEYTLPVKPLPTNTSTFVGGAKRTDNFELQAVVNGAKRTDNHPREVAL